MFINPPRSLFRAAALSVAVAYAPFASAAIEEVIVTANKRAQSINDVGLSISALSADKLTEQKLTSLEEISSAVPGLVYSASTANTPIFTLRGVGFNEQTLGAYPATSLYLDEAPMPFPVLAAHASYDLERVEVLKGPQGILFGQNSTGGAINFISAKPTEEFEGGADFSFGSFKKAELNGYISGPVTDNLGARLAISTAHADDWQQSISRPGDENGSEQYMAARLTTVFEPSDSVRILASYNMWNDRSDPQAQQLVAINPQIAPFDAAGNVPPNLAAVVALPLAPERNRLADWSPEIDPSSDRDYYQIILRGDLDLSDGLTLTALTTYQDFEQTQNTDGDGSALVLFDLAPVVGEIDSWISEIRLAGSGDSLNWVVGANYEQSNTLEEEILHYKDSTNTNAANAFINTSGIALQQDIANYAVFGNVDFNVTEALTLKLGARYTDSSNEVESCNSATPNDPGTIDVGQGANVATLFNVLGDLLNGGDGNFTNGLARPFNIIGVGDCYTLNENNVPGQIYIDKLEEDNVSWRIGADFNVSENTLIYGNVSKGYKAGSFPALAAANFFQLDPVTQESVMSYEVGFKSSLADNTVQFNGAAFMYEYDDKQLRTKTLDPIFGLLDVLDNVPETEIFGFEADVVAEVVEGLTLTAALTYLDSEVVEYKNGVGFNGATGLDFSGDPIPFTPELTYSVGADYRVTTEGGFQAFIGVNMTGQSESEAAFGASRLQISAAQIANGAKQTVNDYNVMDDYQVVNLRMGIEAEDESWKIMLWGKNIGDEYYVTNVVASSDSSARFVGRPATYGVSVGLKF